MAYLKEFALWLPAGAGSRMFLENFSKYFHLSRR
jgi:hypothetical protein